MELEANEAFNKLKGDMSTTLVLTMQNFSLPFIYRDWCLQKCGGAVLMQQGRLIAYFNKALRLKYLGLSTYDHQGSPALVSDSSNSFPSPTPNSPQLSCQQKFHY